jgi:hypothetical protein
MNSHYSSAKTTQSDSARAGYHTALERAQDTVCIISVNSHHDSHDDPPDSPSLDDNRSSVSQSAKSVERLQSEGNFTPRFTDSRHLRSLSPRIQEAVATINKLGLSFPETADDGDVLNGWMLVTDKRTARGLSPRAVKPYREGGQVTLKQSPKNVQISEDTQMSKDARENVLCVLENQREITGDTDGPRGLAQSRQNVAVTHVETKAEEWLDPELKALGDNKKLTYRRKKECMVPIDQRLDSVEYDCLKTDRECQGEERILDDNPPQDILAEGLFSVREAMGHYFENDGAIQISPDAPRSSELARTVKNQPPIPRLPDNTWFSKAWGITREQYGLGRARRIRGRRTLGVDWRPCTYEEVTWE